MNNYVLIIIAAILSALLSILIATYVKKINKSYIFFLAIVCAITLLYMYTIIYKNNDMGRMYTIIKIISILIVTFISYKFFQEKISTKNILGIIFAIIAIILLAK